MTKDKSEPPKTHIRKLGEYPSVKLIFGKIKPFKKNNEKILGEHPTCRKIWSKNERGKETICQPPLRMGWKKKGELGKKPSINPTP